MNSLLKPEHIGLFQSIANGKQYLDMGRTPVEAISIAFEWRSKGLITIADGYHLQLTTKGADILKSLQKELKKIQER